MAILDPQENYNPKIGLKNIFSKLVEIIENLNTAITNIATNAANIAQNTLGISLLENSLGPIPKMYKALISQNAPIATQTSGTFTVGMIVSTTTYVAGDDFSNWTLVSGTVNTTGAVYQVTEAAPTVWTNSSDLAYDGAPFVVSLDGDGILNPFLNTLSGTPVWSYTSAGLFLATLTGEFLEGKTTVLIGSSASSMLIVRAERNSDNDIVVATEVSTTGTGSDGEITNCTIFIEVNT